MSTLDELNIACAAYAKELTTAWRFTGWKSGQGNFRLHAQWFRADEYKGEKYYSCLQCIPVEFGDGIPFAEARENMKMALDDIVLFNKLVPAEPLRWGGGNTQ